MSDAPAKAWNYGDVGIAPSELSVAAETRDAAHERDLACVIPWTFMLISEHVKKVIACPYHTRPYGDLEKNTLDEIWNGPIAREMRHSLLEGEIPLFCLNFSVACPVITKRKTEQREIIVPERIDVGQNDYWVFGKGWYGLEGPAEPIRWTSDRAEFKLQVAGKNVLFIRARIDKPDIETAAVSGYLLRDGQRVGSFDLHRNGWHDLLFPIAPDADARASNFEIVIDHSWSPAEGSSSDDARQLGIAVKSMWAGDLPDRIEVGINDEQFFGHGWYQPEYVPEMIRWASGRSELTIQAVGKRRLHIQAMLNKGDVRTSPVRGSVWCGEVRVGTFNLRSHGWHELEFSLPKASDAARSRVTICIDRPWSAGETVGNGDERPLGIAVRAVWAT